MRNMLATLLLSQGTPMLLAGDEFGRTQHGNNNAYCQDNEISWLDWDIADAQHRAAARASSRSSIALRQRAIPILRRSRFLTGRVRRAIGRQGRHLDQRRRRRRWRTRHWADARHARASACCSTAARSRPACASAACDATLLIILNAHHDVVNFTLPRAPEASAGELLIDTNVEGKLPKPRSTTGDAVRRDRRGRCCCSLLRRLADDARDTARCSTSRRLRGACPRSSATASAGSTPAACGSGCGRPAHERVALRWTAGEPAPMAPRDGRLARAGHARRRAPGTRYRFVLDGRAARARPGLALPAGRRARPERGDRPRGLRLAATRLARPAVARGGHLRAARRHLHARGHVPRAPSRSSTISSTLGITAIELMPVADFPGARNWGYDGVLPYAPDAPTAGPRTCKALVDAAHARGLMVLLDVVYNHFGPDGNYLPRYAPQFFTERAPHALGRGDQLRRTGRAPGARLRRSTTRSTGSRSSTSTACASTPCTRSSTTARPHLLDELAERVRASSRRPRTSTSCSRTRTTSAALLRTPSGEPRAVHRAVERRRPSRAARRR